MFCPFGSGLSEPIRFITLIANERQVDSIISAVTLRSFNSRSNALACQVITNVETNFRMREGDVQVDSAKSKLVLGACCPALSELVSS